MTRRDVIIVAVTSSLTSNCGIFAAEMQKQTCLRQWRIAALLVGSNIQIAPRLKHPRRCVNLGVGEAR